MAQVTRFKGVMQTTPAIYSELINNGSVTVDGTTYEYDPGMLYVTEVTEKSAVNSINGKTGDVQFSSEDLTDGSTLLHTTDIGTSAGKIPVLSSNGKLDESLLPAVALTDIYEASSESTMLALIAQKGDVCIRTDINKTFVLRGTPANVLSNWIELRTPTNTVLSVNGKTGAIELASADLTDGNTLAKTTEVDAKLEAAIGNTNQNVTELLTNKVDNSTFNNLEERVTTAETDIVELHATKANKADIPEDVKLYESTGTNTDGAMTQKATTMALELKATTADIIDAVTFAEEERQKSKNLISLYTPEDPDNLTSGYLDIRDTAYHPFFAENFYICYPNWTSGFATVWSRPSYSDDGRWRLECAGTTTFHIKVTNLKPNTPYTFSFTVKYCMYPMYFLNCYIAKNTATHTNPRTITFITDANGEYVFTSGMRGGSSSDGGLCEVINFQLEESSAQTDYVAPEGNVVRDLSLYHHSFGLTVSGQTWRTYGINLILPTPTKFTKTTFAKWLYNNGYTAYNRSTDGEGTCLWLSGSNFGAGGGYGTPLAVFSTDGSTITVQISGNNTLSGDTVNSIVAYSRRNIFKDYVFGMENGRLD